MKKGFIILTALCLITLTSCKKDWICSCDIDVKGDGLSFKGTFDEQIVNKTKSKAEAICDEGDEDTVDGEYYSKVECELK